jgi:hypothetical protein
MCRRACLVPLLPLLLGAAPAAGPVDFAKLDRRIAREPTYQGKPLYCLALLGPESATRVWMVLDGERLYVDKNANGDLTDDGPPTELKAKNTDPASFEIVNVSPDGGKTVYKFDVTLWGRPSFRGNDPDPNREPFNQSVHVTFPDGRWFGAWGDHLKPLVFTPKPQDAPVLHFGGPLRMGFEIRQPLAKERDGFKLSACVGTPGSCPGAWVHLLYTTIPKGACPRAVLEFPPEKPGGPPVRVEFALRERC